MKYAALVIPVIFIALFVYAAIKKVKIYDEFCVGAATALKTVYGIFPYVATVILMTELFRASGLSDKLINFLSPFFGFLGVPKEITPLVLMKPFSGSGSLSVLGDILQKYGADSYIGRCACSVFGSTETVFYVSAVYYSTSKVKKTAKPIIISLSSSLVAIIIACLLCKVM